MRRTDEILWKDYRRHETRQVETLLDFLQRMEAEAGISPDNCRVFMTGSGGNMLADLIGAKYVQEVLAASLMVEQNCPEAASFVEIGGQDAKIVILNKDPETGRIKKTLSMNDKCAGGTGAVIDKISMKLGIPLEDLCKLRYTGIRLHPVAGKCGVFAETDINGLQKQGIPAAELMASLFDAFVLQNLKVLARGHTLLPQVLLLGGPNAFIPGMREAFQHNIALMWEERGVTIPQGAQVEDLIRAPRMRSTTAHWARPNSARKKPSKSARYLGKAQLEDLLAGRSGARGKGGQGMPALVASQEEVEDFSEKLRASSFQTSQIQSRRYRARLYRRRRRIHLHQSGASVTGGRGSRQGLPALQGQSDRRHHRNPREAAQPG